MKRRALWFKLLVLAGAAALTAHGQEKSAVTGKVLTPDGKPAVGATVWLVVNRWEVGQMTVESKTLTNVKGEFSLPFKTPLRVYSAYVIAHHPNFAVGWQSFDPRDLKPLTVRLRQPAPLTGTVLTPEGKPLAGAKLQVVEVENVRSKMAFETTERELISEEMPEEVSPFWTVTDLQGRFVFRNLPANTQIYLRVHHPDYAPARLPQPEEWFPIRTGTEEVTLVAVPKSFLKGQVLRNGQPVKGAQVICKSEFYGEREYRASTDENGEFEIALHLGRWFVYASAEEGKWQSELKFISVVPGQTLTLNFKLQRAVEIKGVVKDAETKNPVPFAEVYADRQIQAGVEGEPPRWWRSKEVKADEKGNFTLFLLPGKWTVRAWASYSPDHFAEATKEVELKGESVDLSDLLLQSPRKLTVQVVDEKGKPVPKAIVSSGSWLIRQADEKGNAQIEYPPKQLWAASPDMTKFGMVEVKPEAKSVQITVEKGIPVSGQVTDEDGKPIPNARIWVRVLQRDPDFPFEMPNDWFEVYSDKGGQFRFHLPSGVKFQLTVLAEGFFPTATEPTISEDKPVTMTVKVKRPNLVLTGKVVDGETGQPVWGAAVRVWLMTPGGAATEWGALIAFTNERGEFRLTGLHSEHLGDFTVYHPAYRPFREWRPSLGQQFLVRLERYRPVFIAQLAVGNTAPPLSDVKWLDGEAPSLRGKTTYLLFAMPYDPACEQAIQRLKELQSKSPGEVQVIVVFDASLPADELRQYARELQLPFHIGTVPEGQKSGWDSETFQIYGVKAVPMLVVIDEQGVVKAVNPEGD